MAEPYRFRKGEDDSLKQDGCRRSSGRRHQEMLFCDLGVVLDLSAGGMKVLSRRAPGKETLETELISNEGRLVLKARVAWSKRSGFGKTEVGLEFIDVDKASRAMLARISTAHRMFRHNVA